MKIILLGKLAVIKAMYASILLSNNVIEPYSMQQANELLLKENFDLVIYGVHTNADGSRVKKSKVGNMEVIHVAERFTCEGHL